MQIQLPPLPPVHVVFVTPEPLFYTQWDFWLSVGTLLLAGITGWLALETRKMRQGSDRAIGELSKHAADAATASAASSEASKASAEALQSQAQDTKAALEIAKRNFDAAERSANAAEDSAQSSARFAQNGQRAWIFVSSIGRPPRETTTTLGAMITFRNGGPTPATHLWFETYICGLKEFPTDPQYSSDDNVLRGGVLGPLSNVDVPISMNLAVGEIEAFRKDQICYFIYGFVSYRDIFGESHKTKYCLIYNRKLGTFVYHSVHNEIS